MCVDQLDVTHCVWTLWRGGLLLPWWSLLLLLLGQFSPLRLLILTAQCPQLLVLLGGKQHFGLVAVQVFFESDGGAGSKMRFTQAENITA